MAVASLTLGHLDATLTSSGRVVVENKRSNLRCCDSCMSRKEPMSTPVTHDATRHRFETEVDGHVGYIEYHMAGNAMSIDHTIVPSEIGGRGIAGALMKTALDYARAEGLKVIPACSYAAAYLVKHPEYEDLRNSN